MSYPLIIGNWKLNGNKNAINNFIIDLQKKLTNITDCTVAIAPPLVYLTLAKRNLIDKSNIYLAAQNVDVNLSGAYTGEVSAKMLKDIGVKYVIVGHSERRKFHQESNKTVAKKFVLSKNQDLIPILCIGETKEEKYLGKTEEIFIHQINSILENNNIKIFENTIIAYEPIWAIGTKIAETPAQIQKVNKFIRNYISSIDKKIADQLLLLYGGSVNVNNAENLFAQSDIDGVLIGTSSLVLEDFFSIISSAYSIFRLKDKHVKRQDF